MINRFNGFLKRKVRRKIGQRITFNRTALPQITELGLFL